MKLSIVIPVWNNWHLTKSCIQDLSKLKDVEIIIVDNGSSDDTKTLDSLANLKVIRNLKNEGFAKACNKGYANAQSDVVMFLNNDIRVKKDFENWVDVILESINDNVLVGPNVGVLDQEFNFIAEGSVIPKRGYIYMSGWNLTATKTVWSKLLLAGEDGPFTSEMGLAYFEDTDLGLRAQELGIEFKIVSVPVIHLGKMTSKKLDLGSLYLGAKKIFIAKWSERAKVLWR